MTEKKAATKTSKPNVFVRIGRAIANFFKKIGNAFKNMWHELRKVTWPTREKLVNYSIIVLLFMLFMMVIIGLLDLGASSLVQWVMRTFNTAA